MDLMKVFDQTVREIKREVNLKVLKVPEIEQKVLDATDDEPWGPHGTVLAEIARATNKFSECQMVMNVLWARLTETGKNWRFVYKALAVIEYLVAHGSERVVDDIVEHTFQISSLASFEYVEPNGKDLGINVRKKAETIVALLNNKDKIQEVRNKATENRDKYFGLSSTGITYKSGSATFSGSGSQSSERYGGFGSEKYGNSSRDSHKDRDRYDEHKSDQSSSVKSRRQSANSISNASRKGSSHSKLQGTRSSENVSISTQASAAPSNKYDDDYDDFDPRGISGAKPSSGTSQTVDLFGQDLMSDWLDAPTPVSTDTVPENSLSEVDLFADADFVSATSHEENRGSSHAQENVDLFASQPTSSSAAPPVLFDASDSLGQSENKSKSIDNTSSNAFDPFAAQDPSGHSDNKSKNIDNTASNVFDPFAAIPLNSFDSADPFGTFGQNHANDSVTSSLDEVVTDNKPVSQSNLNGSSVDVRTQQKKDMFQVKSGIWSDSLSRGLIDLNISAPKKVNLADVGVMGGLTDGSDEMEKGPSLFYKGQTMGSGSGLRKSGFHSPPSEGDDFFSSFSSQQYQFGGLQK